MKEADVKDNIDPTINLLPMKIKINASTEISWKFGDKNLFDRAKEIYR